MDEDEAALLAELKAISNSSSSRFQDNNDDDAPPPSQEEEARIETPCTPSSRNGGSSSLRQRFRNRFSPRAPSRGAPADDNDDDMDDEPMDAVEAARMAKADPPVVESKPMSPAAVRVSKRETTGVPPWKRKAAAQGVQKQQQPVDVVLAASAPGKGGFQSEIPSTFKGDRGGTAEDEELLALLRGVSAKSGPSRFDDDDNETNNNTTENAALEPPEPAPAPRSASKRETGVVPPWKRKSAKAVDRPKVDVVIAAPPAPAPVQEKKVGYGIKSEIPSTFKGDRGGAAEDEELLALLRGVSAKSGASRFDDDDNDNHDDTPAEPIAAPAPAPAPQKSRPEARVVPPWKRKSTKAVAEQPQVDVVIAAPPAPDPAMVEEKVGYGIKSEIPSTFKGDRGGAAEDEELLALLRGVSAKSGASRFDDEDDNGDTPTESFAAPAPEPAPAPRKSKPASSVVPPWKRKSTKAVEEPPQVDVVIAAPPAPPAPALVEEKAGYGIKSEIPSTFKGDRGGAAEDEELLALLRGVSAKSGASRFDDDDNDTPAEPAPAPAPEPAPRPAPKPKRDSGGVPPWKRKSTKAAEEPQVDVVVAAPAAPGPSPALVEEKVGYGIKSEIPSTFKGDRGGAAEDEELLALLRGVSAKSGASRFDDEDDDTPTEPVAAPAKPAPVARPATKPKRGSDAVPPWKKKATTKPVEKQQEADSSVVVAAPPVSAPPQDTISENVGYGLKSEIPSTFKGDRGGAAEDEELLALLRGVSAKSSSADRFADSDEVPDEAPREPASRATKPSVSARPANTNPPPAATPPRPTKAATSSTPSEDALPREDLAAALADKNWKRRVQAYELLSTLLVEVAPDGEAAGTVDGADILPGLDDQVPKFVEDTNAGALDKALEFAVLYADHCQGAGDAARASAIATSLVKKNGLSGRPSTLKLATALAFKLMEVGSDGVASVHAVIDVLLREGVTSKKPKIVQASAAMIFDAACEFGAASLPLASVVSSAPKMLSHTNAKVREAGLKLVAEICRALGSRAPVQSVIDGMKKAQISELDALLTQQPEATPVRTQLRSRRQSGGSTTSAAPEDALAALQAGAKELEAQRYAARPAVALMQVLPTTDYSSRLALQKWSEKVAALDLVLESAGEKPYKLAPQSSANSYIPLISDMKKLLSHTHFAVCSKAMQVLAMLAEGVGEKLFSYLRPLISSLLLLSKDKKLTRAVAGCLDAFFGNVVGFDHLLDADDSLPTALEEKKQKNALARASALEFLQRCVERGEAAGPRASLTPKQASAVGELCADKLKDSDAGVRKAALETLKQLQNREDESIAEAASVVIESLKTANPRAYKTLSAGGTSKGGGGTSAAVATPATAKAEARPSPTTRSKTSASSAVAPSRPSASVSASSRNVVSKPKQVTSTAPLLAPSATGSADSDAPTFEAALANVARMNVPQWGASDDDGGVLVGLQSPKWLLRQNAVKALTSFVESGQLDDSHEVASNSSAILVVVKEHSRGLKETNVNIMKAIIELLIALCDYHEAKECLFASWATRDAAEVAAQKISDKKLSPSCKHLLTMLCVVASPFLVLSAASESLKSVKAPAAHEEFLKWFESFCKDFGALSIGKSISEIIPWMLEELGSTNPKVKRAATTLVGVIHSQVGPSFKALSVSMAQKAGIKDQLEKSFDDHPFIPSSASNEWSRQSLFAAINSKTNGGSSSDGGLQLDVPKSDLFGSLPPDVVRKLGSKEGKASWKFRKEALDEVEAALKGCSGMVDTSASKMKELVELTRALRDRLSDTQINLKPVAARNIGMLLSLVEKTSQAKLGRVVYGPLINAAMTDVKKPMRDASLEAMRVGTIAPSLDGGGPNEEGLEAYITALVSEVTESTIRAGGLADVLLFVVSVAENLPDLDALASSRGQSLGEKYSAVIVECLTSSKSDTRAAATTLLDVSIEKGIVSVESLHKATGRLKPANQRSVAPIIAKFSKKTPLPVQSEKENVPAAEPPSRRRPDQSSNVASTRSTRRLDTAQSYKASTTAPDIRTPSGKAPEQVASQRGSATGHPLISRTLRQNQRLGRSIVWPEYPEVPQGSPLMETLKRYWSPLLPPSAVSALFPPSGIKKQDDASAGMDVLSRALLCDQDEGSSLVQEQLDPIMKWIAFVLCCKETTVGLQELLALVKNLFSYLLEQKRELSDSEALLLPAILIEKASVAKGRFHNLFAEIVDILNTPELLPPKRLGAIVCVAMLEGSGHAKARVLACQLCVDCVEKVGLSGVGKKGVLSASKLLSEESIPENRSAALDVMEIILSRMNGDMQRLVRICGPNLSDKARQLLEERWRKRPTTDPSVGSASSPSAVKTSGAQAIRSPDNELPSFSLRGAAKPPTRLERPTRSSIADPFSLSASSQAPLNDSPATPSDLPESLMSYHPTSFDSSDVVSKGREEGDGAAAALRARLMKIREKSKIQEEAGPGTMAAPVVEEQSLQQPKFDASLQYTSAMDSVRGVLSKQAPLDDDDEDIERCVEALKMFHAALSGQQNPSSTLNGQELLEVRSILSSNIGATLEGLSRLIPFAFDCGHPSVNAGLCKPLLSVTLATLMALFRDSELSKLASHEYLTALIRETGTALLDPRLSSSSELDDATGAQMVRAINKLAVQAATGATRHSALMALLTLQQQLALETVSDDAAFGSRLSRVVAKLFGRVIKAEEALPVSYASEDVDMESLVCAMEDVLVGCQRGEDEGAVQSLDSLSACRDMVANLVRSILQATGGVGSFFQQMEYLGIDPEESLLGVVVADLSAEESGLVEKPLGISEHSSDGSQQFPAAEAATQVTEMPASLSPLRAPLRDRAPPPSKDVATLVSVVGSTTGAERAAALEALRTYQAEHGDEALQAHLGQVSSQFRAYVQEELAKAQPSQEKVEVSAESSVSERLRTLRTRLQATERVVQAATADTAPPEDPSTAVQSSLSQEADQFVDAVQDTSPAATRTPTKIPSPSKRMKSRLTMPSPSKVALTSQSVTGLSMPTGTESSLGSSASLTLRERLAAANDQRQVPAVAGSSMTRAAALRARLEAVKQQSTS